MLYMHTDKPKSQSRPRVFRAVFFLPRFQSTAQSLCRAKIQCRAIPLGGNGGTTTTSGGSDSASVSSFGGTSSAGGGGGGGGRGGGSNGGGGGGGGEEGEDSHGE